MSDVNQDSLVIVGERRKRGRPRVEEPMTNVCVRVPVTLYDTLAKLSLKHDQPVAALVRELLVLRIPRV